MNIVEPHNIVSRPVESKDLNRVVKDALEMIKLCYEPNPGFSTAYAIAHCQVEAKDPLRFFVVIPELYEPMIIINPEITQHTKVTIDSEEGCVSYPERGKVIVQRHNKVEVQYLSVERDGDLLTTAENRSDSLGGRIARVFAHEIDHMNSVYIYKEE